jgi:hypothetical protein
LDPASVKEVLVAATALASNIKPILDKPDTTDDMKNIVNMMMVMMTVLEAIVEKGIEPLSAVATGIGNVSSGRPFANAARRLMNPPPPTSAKPSQPGRKELIDALKKSEMESVIFGANLGPKPVSNRAILNNCFSADLDRKTRERAAKDKADTAESLRLVEDALSCVEQIEFLGGRSKPYVNNRKSDDPLNNTYNTMPVKVIFEDKQARINFELTLRDYSGMRAVQSYPQSIRSEMAVFRKAVMERYPDMVIMTRPDINSLELLSFKKKDGDAKWTQCSETHPIPMNIMLPNYTPPNHITLPDPVEDDVYEDPLEDNSSMDE